MNRKEMRLQWLLWHREFQYLRALSTGNRRYIAKRYEKWREALRAAGKS